MIIPITHAQAEALLKDHKHCTRFSALITERQCLINQAQGRVDPDSTYANCLNCPERVVGKLPPAPRPNDGFNQAQARSRGNRLPWSNRTWEINKELRS